MTSKSVALPALPKFVDATRIDSTALVEHERMSGTCADGADLDVQEAGHWSREREIRDVSLAHGSG